MAAHAPDQSLPAIPSLWREAAHEAFSRSVDCGLSALRAGWLYRRSLRGPVPDRVLFQPADPRPWRLEDADGYFRNRFQFCGHVVDAKDMSIFDVPSPAPAFTAALHEFDWLRHLAGVGSEPARQLTLTLIGEWLQRYSRYSKPAWQPENIGGRILNIAAYGRFFVINSDLMWRSRFFVALRNQMRVLARTLGEAPDGLPRLQAAAGLAVAGICFDNPRSASSGMRALGEEIERQILPDGGHVNRSPETLVEAFRILSMTQSVFDMAGRGTYAPLRSALDRMAPMLRFFRMGDGALAVFNGGIESDPRYVTALLENDDVKGRPFGHAPHSAFQRITAGRTVLVMDVGAPPPGPFATRAHAGCLSFEMSVGAHRLIVNCGAARGHHGEWDTALRATAGHSTLTLADTSSARILAQATLLRFLGPRLMNGPKDVETRRTESVQGVAIEGRHDGYQARFGIVHQRQIALSPKGLTLTGSDRLLPTGRLRRTPYAIRFHIHPDVRVSLAQGGGTVLLKLPSGEGWRFRCSGALAIEESIYCGGGNMRRAEQLVINGQIEDGPVECAWLLEQVGSG